jgi:hypothetical protein
MMCYTSRNLLKCENSRKSSWTALHADLQTSRLSLSSSIKTTDFATINMLFFTNNIHETSLRGISSPPHYITHFKYCHNHNGHTNTISACPPTLSLPQPILYHPLIANMDITYMYGTHRLNFLIAYKAEYFRLLDDTSRNGKEMHLALWNWIPD